jgi:hypothetical protein
VSSPPQETLADLLNKLSVDANAVKRAASVGARSNK